MISHNNLFHPVMYLIDKNVKRHFNAMNGGPTGEGGNKKPGEYIEGIRLERDAKGRLKTVTGWEYLKYDLTYATNGILEKVDVVHQLTGKHLQIRLIYDAKNWLIEVEPEILNEGTGEPGLIDLPNVNDDYYDTP
jgi:hypothetical protein